MVSSDTSNHDQHRPTITDRSPEARRKAVLSRRAGLSGHTARRTGRRAQALEIIKRVASGTLSEGFTHAGNLAYLAILAIFPFFITGAAIFSLLGEEGGSTASIDAVLQTLPPVVAEVIGPVAKNVVAARSGVLLWVGGLFGLWTVGSLVEAIRDILRRAYGTHSNKAFWAYRLLSAGIIIGSVVLLLLSLIAQVLIGAMQEVIAAYIPELDSLLNQLSWSRIVPALGLFSSLYLLFFTLTPSSYRKRGYPKWPGAVLATAWWVGVTMSLPPLLRTVLSYDATYGSLAGIMITLFFFWLVGLGLVTGAELNAALAETPEEKQDWRAKADNKPDTKQAENKGIRSQ